MLQIPKRYLPHTVQVRVPKKVEDGFGGQYEEPVTIEHVRVEPIWTLRATQYQLQDGARGILYIDAVNSEGAFEIPAKSLVTLEGEPSPANVLACHPIIGVDRVHHWEVELS